MRFVPILFASQVSVATASYITCLQIGDIATASWSNKKESCTYTGKVGSNFGINPVNKAE